MKPLVAALLMALAPLSQAHAVSKPEATVHDSMDTPASRQAKGMLQALTHGTNDEYLQYLKRHSPTQNIVPAQVLGLRHQLEHFRLHAVTSASDTHAELLIFDPTSESWALLSIYIDPGPTHAIVGLQVHPTKRPPDVPAPPRLGARQLTAAIQTKFLPLVAADKFSGVVLVAEGETPFFRSAYGYANRQTRTPNTMATQFRFGSMGKMFTSVAIMQLAQVGKIKLSSPIGTYLTDYPNEEIRTKVTIDQLLTHTGGTGDIFGPMFDLNKASLRDLKDYVSLYGNRKPDFDPGTIQEYSNYGFILLGMVIEKVSGLSYDDYVSRNIFGPADMSSTGMKAEDIRVPGRAVGYTDHLGSLRSAADTLPVRGTSAGGGYSTASDLLHFAIALKGTRLLNADYTGQLLNGGITMPSGQFFQYDFGGSLSDGRRFFGHNGGAPGMNGELRMFPDDGCTVVVLTNFDPPSASIIGDFISYRLPSETPVP